MRKLLGIIGGMGPLATVNLFETIVSLTDAKTDQEHVEMIIYNNTSIPDRTDFILNDGENPLDFLIYSARKLESMGASSLIMPCNTAHYFYDYITSSVDVPIINMIDETAHYIKKNYEQVEKVLVMSTKGTYYTGIYEKALSKFGIDTIKIDEEDKHIINRIIYEIKEGKLDIKLDKFYGIVEKYKKKGASAFVLGCTELSILYKNLKKEENFIDPISILAISAILHSGKKIKEIR